MEEKEIKRLGFLSRGSTSVDASWQSRLHSTDVGDKFQAKFYNQVKHVTEAQTVSSKFSPNSYTNSAMT